ncbi:Ribose 5-phosphate isomerase B [Bacillus badius]|nr:Ribose 5-phosphate isomerase B [Bacillus badius]
MEWKARRLLRAHRPPRGKRSSLEWKSTASIYKQKKKTADHNFNFH